MNVLASAVVSWRSPQLGSLRAGPLHFTPYGLCAAVGLVAAMGLVRRGARRVGLDAEAAWDAGLFAILSCFVASRLLLILQSPAAFVHHPLLLLGLPSLTLGGMLTAAAATWVYLRRQRLPTLSLLDTFAAPSAILATFLELGHWLDGSEAGMPTLLPWGVAVASADPGLRALRVHPVALYGVLLGLLLAAGLWFSFDLLTTFHISPVHHDRPGAVAALGLLGGGMAAFALDMLSVPPVLTLIPGVEPGQWVALAAMLAGALLWVLVPRRLRSVSNTKIFPTEPLHREVH